MGKPGAELLGVGQSEKSGKVETDYPFAKYNIQVKLPKYSDEEYRQHLQDPRWSKEETDYLMELVLEYDLRWIIIADRYEFPRRNLPDGTIKHFNDGNASTTVNQTNISIDQDVAMSNSDSFRPKDSSTMSNPDPHLQQVRDALVIQGPPPRTMEEMKSRYYTVAAKIMALRTPLSSMTSSEFELHEKMTQFNPNSELQRKDIASKLLSRDPAEIQEEELLLSELKRIVQNEDKLIQERNELYDRLEAPPSSGNISMYQSSQGLQQLMQQLLVADRNKKRRSLTGPNDNTASPATAPQTGDSRHPMSSADRGQRGSQPGSATTKTRPASGFGPKFKRLSRAEEARYGIQHHERITSGVTFRTARIDKLITAKSTAQSQKLTAALTELGIPSRLFMPTAKVCAEFERLIASIQTLLEVRKLSEKLEAEIRVLRQMKEDQNNGDGTAEKSDAAQGQIEEGGSKLEEGDSKMSGVDAEDDNGEDENEKENASAAEPEEEADDDENEKQSEDEEDAEAEIDEEEEEEDDDDDGAEGETQNLGVEEEDAANSGLEDDPSEGDGAEENGQSDEEEDNDSEGEDAKSRTSVALSTRSSRVRTKRSASLMSSTSRQSNKRQKK